MPQDMTNISSKTILGSVNCYLLKAGKGFILIDSGWSTKRAELEKELEVAGCKPGSLRMVIITHGDYDHTGNCAFLREKYGTKIAIHKGDTDMVESGDMFRGRKNSNIVVKAIAGTMMSLLGLKSKKFKPDIYLKDGHGLSEYGLDAKVIHIPGHSSGSIGVLAADGSLFCGDLLENTKKPAFNSIMDDKKTASASVDKLKSLNVTMVYPGHGRPFTMNEFFSDK